MGEVKQDTGFVRRRKRVAMHSGARRRRQFNEDVVVVQSHRVEARRRFFILMTEVGRVSFFGAHCRHQQDIAVVGNARAAEVRVAEAVENRIAVVITRTAVPAGQASVRAELDHPERNNRAGKRVTVPGCADEWIDVTRKVSLCVDLNRDNKQQKKD